MLPLGLQRKVRIEGGYAVKACLTYAQCLCDVGEDLFRKIIVGFLNVLENGNNSLLAALVLVQDLVDFLVIKSVQAKTSF